MKQPGLSERHRDLTEIKKKHGSTRVSTLRKLYGDDFAPDASAEDTLYNVLETIDRKSSAKIISDYKRGGLIKLYNGALGKYFNIKY